MNVPKSINDNVTTLLAKLNLDVEPVCVPLEPQVGAIYNDCFPTVKKQIQQSGGKEVLG